MYRCLWMGSVAALLLMGSTGCLHHNVRGGGSCSTGSCGTSACESTGDCGSGACGEAESAGVLGRLCQKKSCGGGCNTGACGGNCSSGNCSGGSGMLGKLGAMTGMGNCGCQGCRTGCQAGPLGWQQGGLDYSSHLQPGLLGHNAGQQLNSRQFTPGPPTGQVAYPYYSVRGPRDFFVDNPPTIGR